MTPADSDLTRKERREQARAHRKAHGGSRGGQSAQRKRLIQLGAVAGVVVVIIAIILVATGSGGSKNAPAPKSTAANSALRQWLDAAGHPPEHDHARQSQRARHDPVLRRPGVPVLQAVHAQRAADVIQKYVRTGKVKIEYNSMETATRKKKSSRPSRSPRSPPASRTGVELRRALLPRAGRRGQRLCHRKLPAGVGCPDTGLEPLAVE